MTKAKQGGVNPYFNAEGKRIGWRILWYDHRGKRKEQKLTDISKTDAWAIWRSRMARGLLEQEGVEKAAARMRLDEAAVERWKHAAVHATPETLRWQRGIYKRHIGPYLGRRMLSELDLPTVQDWIALLKRGKGRMKKRTDNTIVDAERILTLVVRHAARMGHFGPEHAGGRPFTKPWAGVTKPKKPKTGRPAVRSEAQMVAVLNAANEVGGTRAALACALAAFAGARRGELPVQRWHHELRFTANGVPVMPTNDGGAGLLVAGETITSWLARHGMGEVDGLEVYVEAETAKDNEHRLNLISSPGIVRLAMHHYAEQQAWACSRGIEVKHVFIARRQSVYRGEIVAREGQPVERVVRWVQWKRIRELAGLVPKFRFHDLRGSYAKNLLAAGVSLEAVRQLMGHESIETTQRYLRELGGHDAVRAAQALEKIGGVDFGDGRTSIMPPLEDRPAAKRARPALALGDGDTPFGIILRQARLKANVSQRDLAEALANHVGGSKSTWQQRVSRMERASYHQKGNFFPATAKEGRAMGRVFASMLGDERLRFVPMRPSAQLRTKNEEETG